MLTVIKTIFKDNPLAEIRNSTDIILRAIDNILNSNIIQFGGTFFLQISAAKILKTQDLKILNNKYFTNTFIKIAETGIFSSDKWFLTKWRNQSYKKYTNRISSIHIDIAKDCIIPFNNQLMRFANNFAQGKGYNYSF